MQEQREILWWQMLAVLCLAFMNEDRRKQGAENEQQERIGTQGVQGGMCDKL